MLGRPTKYNDDIIAQAADYVDNFEADEIEVFPSIEGLARKLGISRETVYAWADEENKKIFSDITKRLMANQKFFLSNGGLAGRMNPAITKLLLTKHGLSDKVDTTGTLDIDLSKRSLADLKKMARGE